MKRLALLFIFFTSTVVYSQVFPQTYDDVPSTISLSYVLENCDNYEIRVVRGEGLRDVYERGETLNHGKDLEYFQNKNIRFNANGEAIFKGTFKQGKFWSGGMGIYDSNGLLTTIVVFKEGKKSHLGDHTDF